MDTVKAFIIDKSQIARQMLINLLADIPWLQFVGEAGTGQGGVIMFEEEDPDIIFIDSEISGGMTLVEVITEVKAIDPDIKIILIVNQQAKSVAEEASRIGVFDFIRKPYQKTNIIRVINESLSEA